MIWSKFPWSDSHNLNLDWVITAVKECQNAIKEFAEKIPQAIVKTVDGHSADDNGNINITGVVRKLWGHTPNSAGELNPRETNGNFTIAGDLGATGNAIINGYVEAAAGNVRAINFLANAATGLPNINIFQPNAGVLKFSLPDDGGREQYAIIRVGAPSGEYDSEAVTLGYLKTLNKPLQLVTNDTGGYKELAWSAVGFTYADVQRLWSSMNSTGGIARILYIGTGQYPTTIICNAAYSQNGKYIFFGGADDGFTRETDIDEAETCYIRIDETGIEIERGSR